jgi:GNAT superfamily N-acetyltransferase
METEIIKTGLEEIKALRVLFLQENNFQFIYNKCHDYGWADTYLFKVNGTKIGYAAVWGQSKREDRDAIFEFYLIPSYRKFTEIIFPKFHALSGAVYIECQTNDGLLSPILYEFCENINAEAVLFEDSFQSTLQIPGTVFRQKTAEDKTSDDMGDYLLLLNGEIVADGGLMLNYNIPFADIYMKVNENFRQQGFGSLLVQELKKQAYLMGRVPAARCNIRNHISKSTLQKAGFKVCGFIVLGTIKKTEG